MGDGHLFPGGAATEPWNGSKKRSLFLPKVLRKGSSLWEPDKRGGPHRSKYRRTCWWLESLLISFFFPLLFICGVFHVHDARAHVGIGRYPSRRTVAEHKVRELARTFSFPTVS